MQEQVNHPLLLIATLSIVRLMKTGIPLAERILENQQGRSEVIAEHVFIVRSCGHVDWWESIFKLTHAIINYNHNYIF